ncbi:MAG: polysaccharide biosynthesis protein [Prevotella sp.]|nr:polysaccharide biosynthesis protein [Prevotella sp.]
MANLKNLAKETAIYGLSSIIGRFLNYLLVPLYTAKLAAEGGGYGIITNIYAYVALLLILLTYGMETTFFRFINKEEHNADKVYSTTLGCITLTSSLFVMLVLIFINPLSDLLGYASHPSYIWVMAITVALDAIQGIPFAYLRHKKKAIKFASLKLLFIVMNIGLNLFFFLVLPHFTGKAADVGYAFYINLACTSVITLFFWNDFPKSLSIDGALLRQMLRYAWPILILGIAGILNQTADKILFPYIYKGDNAHAQLGIYGAASKIAMIMAMIMQAFRYAYEPFVFSKVKDKDSRDTYAQAMKYFIIFTLLAFLAVMAYMDVLKHIIAPDYWSGLRVVPIVMAAEIMMGIYFNLSFWYKLTDKTIWGALFSGIGCIVLIGVNVIFVPQYGYMACAWAGVAGYGTAMILSYVIGQKKFPIKYPIADIATYMATAAVLTAVIYIADNHLQWGFWARMALNTACVCAFAAMIIKRDMPLSALPVIGKYFRKR